MEDKIVVITGSTSSIGLEIARHFAALKANIVINGLGTNELSEQVTIELKSLGASNILYYPANLANSEEITKMFEAIIDKFGKLDILANNADIQFVSPIEDFPLLNEAEDIENIRHQMI